ncbi:hypothetical protein BS78_K189400 [Paspalum vaginatum]|uniref:BTB domain-containing protein n=1 Tax=Paspalum vaginatum TaxID=158149 RepID=A0A9W8CE86_9POAL|nr:hypothetical protein BS78_K189400 [Paspalum vaginatum]
MPALDFASANVALGTYLLHVDHSNGQRIKTPSFSAGDCYWRIYCYPNGTCPSRTDHMSIVIDLDGRVPKPIKAQVRFSLLDQDGALVPGHSVCTGITDYSEVGDSCSCDFFIHKEFLGTSEYLVNDCFTVACDVSVYRASPLSDLQQHLLGTGADVVFQVGGHTFGAHRRVLAARSPVLEAELSKGTTAGDPCTRIDGVLPHVFMSLLHFVYTDSLPHMTAVEEPTMAEHLLAAADRFSMQELKLVCEEKIIRELNHDTAAKILKLAVQHRSSFLKEACIEFLEGAPVLEAAMAMDDELCEHVAKFCPVLLKNMWAYEEDPMQDELAMCF